MNIQQNTNLYLPNLITISHLYKEHGKDNSFSLLLESFNVKNGELIALVGPSGCGKSTALDLISTSLIPTQKIKNKIKSTFYFCPETIPIDILSLWKKNKQNTLAELRRQHMGYVLQTGGLFPFLTGYDNIALACLNTKHSKSIQKITQTLNINHLLHKKPVKMSVGERQRFAIARALIHEPKLILADEPVAALDPYNAKIVLELFSTIAKQKNISIVMVSHSPELAREAGFRLITTKVSHDSNNTFAHINTNIN